MVDLTLPEVIEPEIYRQRWPDLRAFSQDALYRHYATYGEGEGRQANRLVSRKDFIALIPPDSDTLEIGPYCNPLLTGPHVQYFDVLPTSALFTRAISMGVESPNVPTINFVSPTGDLSVVDRSFSYVVSSHCLEHQPNVISHLQEIERILSVQGRYFILVPDKRYCFDAFITESTVADVLDAHHTGRTTHALKSVIEHRALTTHNDSRRHWLGDHGSNSDNQAARIAAALLEYKKAAGSYIDVHAWYFTPRSALIIINTLQNLGYISLELERLYPTRKFSNEFWIVLRKPGTDGRK